MDKLIKLAMEARENAYAPYSKFRVGAAIEAAGGKIYTGCNVEEGTLGLTVCAERVAIWKAVSDGERDFKRLTVVTDTGIPCAPCGSCRQALAEFCDDLEIVAANTKGDTLKTTLKKLLPQAFRFGR